MEDLVSFWRKKRVFLTGHTGFKGSWLAILLHALEAEVVGYSLAPPTTPSLFSLAHIANQMTHICADIRDFKKLQDTMVSYQPDIVIHMAAQPLVREGYRNPLETYDINVMGTAHVLEAVRYTKSVRAFLNVTTDKCYENHETQRKFQEIDRLGGIDPYSSSKACSELITDAYRKSFFKKSVNNEIGISSARAGNVIGGGDWAKDRIIPDIVRSLFLEKDIVIRSPLATRPWQHILDLLWGYLSLVRSLYLCPEKYSEAWNFGPSEKEAKTVSWIVDQAIQHWGSKIHVIKEKNLHFHEAQSLQLNSAKAKKHLNWSPIFNTEEGLKATLDWYKSYLIDEADPKDLSFRQVYAYLERRNVNKKQTVS